MDRYPSQRLRDMVRNLHTIPVEDLHHQDWHSVLKVLDFLLQDLELLAPRGATGAEIRAALGRAATAANHERLPMEPPAPPTGESEQAT